MKRFARFSMILITLSLPWIDALPGYSQTSMPSMFPLFRSGDQDRAHPVLGEPTQVQPPMQDREQILPPPGPIQMTPTSPGAVNLSNPKLEDEDMPLPINLAAALKLADARPLIVAGAQASAWVAEAELAHAKVLWVPTFNFGFDQYRHDGFGPDLNRGQNTAAKPLNQNDNFFYGGGGFTNMNQTTDMIFTPLAARQNLRSSRFNIQTAKNDALLATATAYFEVHRFRGKYAGALDVVKRGKELRERIYKLSEDLVPKVEVDRAINALADFEQQLASAREEWRVQSAYFTQILRLDPRAVIVPVEPDHLQITLIEPSRSLNDLIPVGLTNRPELASQQALVQAVAEKIRQEKFRPLLPSLYLNGFQTPNEYLQFGAFGLGNGDSMNLWSWRDDFSIQPVWQLDAMGFGNLAKIKEQRGMQSMAIVELFKAQDAVAGEVTRAQARLQSAALRVLQADRSLREAIITYKGNYDGLAQTTRGANDQILIQVYRPQEAVVALEHLKSAYDQYFSTIADYNRSQFQLFHALGYPARELAIHRSPGEPVPVDGTRPGYLPKVGYGPPPATR